jgi:hypothetical protein
MDSDNPAISDFLVTFDLGVPLSSLIYLDACIPNDRGIAYVDAAWEAFCEMLEIDLYGNYPSAEYMFDFSDAEG